jgi:hypothetical protein
MPVLSFCEGQNYLLHTNSSPSGIGDFGLHGSALAAQSDAGQKRIQDKNGDSHKDTKKTSVTQEFDILLRLFHVWPRTVLDCNSYFTLDLDTGRLRLFCWVISPHCSLFISCGQVL